MNRYVPAPVSPVPLSQHNAYTTWPGGVDPTAALYKSDNQRGGRKSVRRRRRTTRRLQRSRLQRSRLQRSRLQRTTRRHHSRRANM